jgi:hypothetical protein
VPEPRCDQKMQCGKGLLVDGRADSGSLSERGVRASDNMSQGRTRLGQVRSVSVTGVIPDRLTTDGHDAPELPPPAAVASISKQE